MKITEVRDREDVWRDTWEGIRYRMNNNLWDLVCDMERDDVWYIVCKNVWYTVYNVGDDAYNVENTVRDNLLNIQKHYREREVVYV